MINFECYSPTVFVSNHINVLGDRISLNEQVVKTIMESQKIRKTKSNIQICKQELIDFINIALSDRWYIIHECNGDFSFKC